MNTLRDLVRELLDKAVTDHLYTRSAVDSLVDELVPELEKHFNPTFRDAIFYGGPLNGCTVGLSGAPNRLMIEVDREFYYYSAVLDPDSGIFLGAYIYNESS